MRNYLDDIRIRKAFVATLRSTQSRWQIRLKRMYSFGLNLCDSDKCLSQHLGMRIFPSTTPSPFTGPKARFPCAPNADCISRFSLVTLRPVYLKICNVL